MLLKQLRNMQTKDVIPTVEAFTSIYRRTDIVFDVYRPTSLKAETRSKCGQGARRRVTDKGRLPPVWRSFFRNNDNKTELFNFLALTRLLKGVSGMLSSLQGKREL